MLAALPTADEDAQFHVVDELLSRDSREAKSGLIHHYGQLSPDSRSLIASKNDGLQFAIREALNAGRSQSRKNAIAMVRESGEVDLLPAVAKATGDGDPAVRDAALDCLLNWQAKSNGASEFEASNEQQTLDAALVEALSHFEKHRNESLIQRLFDSSIASNRRIAHLLASPDSELTAAVRRQIADAKEPVVRQSILRWTATANLCQPALHSVQLAATRGWLSPMLEGGHHLKHGRTRRALNTIADASHLTPTLPQLAAMSTAALQQLPEWISTIPLTTEARVDSYAQIASSNDPGARLFSLRRLINMSPGSAAAGASVTNQIKAFCHDKDARVARVAVRQLIATSPPDLSKTLLRLINSEHDDIRQLAGERVAPWGFIWFWNAWNSISPPQRVSAASALMKIVPNFHRQLANRVLSRREEERVKALSIIADLNQGVFYENALIGIARGQRPREVASAIRGLASVRTTLANDVIEASLAHSDSRVRANAVESLGRNRARDRIDHLETMADRETNRPRANAIAELFKLDRPVAFDALQDMLDDLKPQHRISGLWLADHMIVVGSTPQIAEISVSDNDASVRSRAEKTFSHLVSTMNNKPTRQTLAMANSNDIEPAFS